MPRDAVTLPRLVALVAAPGVDAETTQELWRGILRLATAGANQAAAETAAQVVFAGLGFPVPGQGLLSPVLGSLPRALALEALPALPALLARLSSSWTAESLRSVAECAVSRCAAEGRFDGSLLGALSQGLASLARRPASGSLGLDALRMAARDTILSTVLPGVLGDKTALSEVALERLPSGGQSGADSGARTNAEDAALVDAWQGKGQHGDSLKWLRLFLECLGTLPASKVRAWRAANRAVA